VSRIRLTGGAVGADSFEIGQAIQGVSNTGFSIYDVEATASRLVIDSSGKVGIGNTAPAERLHISGNMRLTGDGGAAETVFAEINAVNGATTSNPGVKIVATTGGTTSRHELAFYTTANNATNTTEKVRIAYNGNVGIGNNAPSQLLEVGTTSAGGNISIVSSSSGANGYLSLVGLDGNAKLQIFSETTTAGFYTPASIPLIFYVSNAERARIDSSGRLLVGTSTARSNFHNNANYTTQFQLEGTGFQNSALSLIANNTAPGVSTSITLAKSAGAGLTSNTLVANNELLGDIRFEGSNGTNFVEAARIRCEIDGGTPGAASMPGRLVFSTTADGASWSYGADEDYIRCLCPSCIWHWRHPVQR
jgi:hypothetical protein